jgi:hypothetical protein
MEAIREIRVLDSNKLILELPESFAKAQVEVVVLRIAPNDALSTVKKRTPSPILAGTRIIGDIMSSVVPDADWDVL